MYDENKEIETLKRENARLKYQNDRLNQEKEYLKYCLDETRNSFTYRFGSIFTYLPRKLKEVMNHQRKEEHKVVSQEEITSYEVKFTESEIAVVHHVDSGEDEYWELPLEYIYWGGRIIIPMTVEEQAKDRILWIHEMTEEEFAKTGEYQAALIDPAKPRKGILCLYTNDVSYEAYMILFTSMDQIYKRFVHMRYKNASVVLRKKDLDISFSYAIYTAKTADLNMEQVELVVDDNHSFPLEQKLVTSEDEMTKFQIKIPLESIVTQETQINNALHARVVVNGVELKYNLGRKKKSKRPTKFYYVPTSSRYYRDYALFIRKNVNQNYTLVVRQKEECEESREFRFLESMPISAILYYTGKLARLFHLRNVNLYYEKNSAKAEEGTYEIFELACGRKQSRNYFILGKEAPIWQEFSKHKNVVAKYSLRYYWLLYTSDYLISTETSSHLNVHRAINYYVRTALLERPLIFLQHGVTYLKRQGAGSVFGKGKEGEPLYMAVGSEKEQQIVCSMLNLQPEQCIRTGLPIFSTISYEHIGKKSEDIVTIMFTWRPSEEHLGNHFEDSSYYQKVRTVYDILKDCMPENKIRIVPHPKVLPLLLETDFGDRIWSGSVADVLKETKLLVTDYSSVCYNSFYQGAGVVFYQPDLEAYEQEVGKLIPADDEYIGLRIFEKEKLSETLNSGIQKGRIKLPVFRTNEYCRRYREINEYSDGKNIERLFAFLIEKGII